MKQPWFLATDFQERCDALRTELGNSRIVLDSRLTPVRIKRLKQIHALFSAIPDEALEGDGGPRYLDIEPFIDTRMPRTIKLRYYRGVGIDGFEYDWNLLYGVRPATDFVKELLSLDVDDLLDHFKQTASSPNRGSR